MVEPRALRKHDGRIVAFDAERLAAGLARALLAGRERTTLVEAEALGRELAGAAAEFLVREGAPVPSSAQVRELVLRLLRDTGHPAAAEAYAEHARAAAALLWGLRVFEPPLPPGTEAAEGVPWDRRRFIESLLACGIARDPAGEVGREVERRLVALGENRISPGVIHALAVLALAARGLDARRYAARRIAACFGPQAGRYSVPAQNACPLPPDGPALEAFWLQAVHSPEVVRAVRRNALGLEPYPNTPADAQTGGAADAADPLREDGRARLRQWAAAPAGCLWVRTDGLERAAELARELAGCRADLAGEKAGRAGEAELRLVLRTAPPAAAYRSRGVAPVVTLNVAGYLAREGVRDLEKVTPQLAHLAGAAALAHREREEYWGFSPLRGRELPVALAGLWNAAAWLHGQPFERPEPDALLRQAAGLLVSALHGALATLRTETALPLALVAEAPAQAAASLWQRDREYFAQDGLVLDPAAGYSVGLELRASPTVEDTGARVDFLRSVSPLFDEPPALRLDAPLGAEPDPSAWRELFTALLQCGVPRARLRPGGSPRSLRLLTRALRGHMEGFPLFEEP